MLIDKYGVVLEDEIRGWYNSCLKKDDDVLVARSMTGFISAAGSCIINMERGGPIEDILSMGGDNLVVCPSYMKGYYGDYNAISLADLMNPEYRKRVRGRCDTLIITDAHRLFNGYDKLAVLGGIDRKHTVLIYGVQEPWKHPPGRLWTLLNLINPYRFSNYKLFRDRYLEWNDELEMVLSTLMWQVPAEPAEHHVKVDIPSIVMHNYEQIVKRDYGHVPLEQLVAFLQKLMACPASLSFEGATPKIDVCIQLVKDMLIEGHKPVVVCGSRQVVRYLHRMFDGLKAHPGGKDKMFTIGVKSIDSATPRSIIPSITNWWYSSTQSVLICEHGYDVPSDYKVALDGKVEGKVVYYIEGRGTIDEFLEAPELHLKGV